MRTPARKKSPLLLAPWLKPRAKRRADTKRIAKPTSLGVTGNAQRYDPEVDALYSSFKKGPTQVTTIRLNEDVAIDLGPGEEVVGIEVLDASEHVNIGRKAPKVVLEPLQAV